MAKPRRQFKGKKGWTPDTLPELGGKVFVITGANSGIGWEAARYLGRRCASVVLLCRDLKKAEEAMDELYRVSPGNADYSAIECDLADLGSVHRAADQVQARHGAIDGLINNAGVMMVPERRETADGFEMQFGTNHLGHFALSALLSPQVEASGGRFVAVSSLAHRATKKVDFDNLDGARHYSPMKAYSLSKLANLSFAIELQRRLALAGCKATSLACHPGFSDTNIGNSGPSRLVSMMIQPLSALFSQSATRGAIPLALAAAGPEAEAGTYYGPTGFQNMGGRVDRAQISDTALDEDTARRLWAVSEAKTGVSWPILQS